MLSCIFCVHFNALLMKAILYPDHIWSSRRMMGPHNFWYRVTSISSFRCGECNLDIWTRECFHKTTVGRTRHLSSVLTANPGDKARVIPHLADHTTADYTDPAFDHRQIIYSLGKSWYRPVGFILVKLQSGSTPGPWQQQSAVFPLNYSSKLVP